MQFKLLVTACLCVLIVGCSTAAGVSKGNIFYSEGSPNIRIQVDPLLKAQDPFSYEVNQKGGDFAGTIKHTVYPFAEVAGKDVKRAFTIAFWDMTRPNQIFGSAGDGQERDFSGVTFTSLAVGNFVWTSLAKEATIRGFNMKGQYSAVLFSRVANPQRLMRLTYIEQTPSEMRSLHWERDRLSEEQRKYLEDLELRGTEAFSVISSSRF